MNETVIKAFLSSYNIVRDEVHRMARSKGWWDTDRNDGEAIALMHSELSEALEGLREGNGPSEKIPAFNKLEEELADCIIRIMDYSAARKLNIAEALLEKIKYNANRPHKHGKNF